LFQYEHLFCSRDKEAGRTLRLLAQQSIPLTAAVNSRFLKLVLKKGNGTRGKEEIT
jgi:hypothetical protein